LGTLTELRQKADSDLRNESAELVAYAWAKAEADESAEVVAVLEREAKEAKAALGDAKAKADAARETLRILERDLAAIREARHEAREQIRTPMLSGGIWGPHGTFTDTPVQRTVTVELPSGREVQAAEFAVNDARKAAQRAEEGLRFLENRANEADKHLSLAKGRVRELRALEKPETPTWAALLDLMGIKHK